jgi:outer membrane protein
MAILFTQTNLCLPVHVATFTNPNFKNVLLMKKLLTVLWMGLLAGQVLAQRFGYIDSQVIMEKMPDYVQMEQEMDKLVEQWKKEIADKQANLLKARADFEAERVLLTEDLKQQRLAALGKLEKDVLDAQTKIFGYDGLMYQKRQEMLKAILGKIYEATKKIAMKRKIATIFDKASDLSMIYCDPQHNYTDHVMEELGIEEKDQASSGQGSGAGQPATGSGNADRGGAKPAGNQPSPNKKN